LIGNLQKGSAVDGVRLDELDKDEMWLVAKALRPELTEEEYEVIWEGFLEMKCNYSLN
jgi:hypothetical protein